VGGAGGRHLAGLLLLFGADYQGLPPGHDRDFALLHLAGVALVAVALILVAARFFTTATLVEQVLAVAIAVNVVLYVISNMPSLNPHEMAVVLSCGAALAGRMLVRETGRELAGKRARAVRAGQAVAALAGAAVLAGFLTGLAREARHPAEPAQNTQLASWLADHHLSYGLGGYWESSIVTVDTGRRVQVRALMQFTMQRDLWESKYAWYVPRGSMPTSSSSRACLASSTTGSRGPWCTETSATRPTRTTSAPTR